MIFCRSPTRDSNCFLICWGGVSWNEQGSRRRLTFNISSLELLPFELLNGLVMNGIFMADGRLMPNGRFEPEGIPIVGML